MPTRTRKKPINPDVNEAMTLAADLVESAAAVNAPEYAATMSGVTEIPADTLAALREAVPAILKARALMTRDVAVTLRGPGA